MQSEDSKWILVNMVIAATFSILQSNTYIVKS